MACIMVIDKMIFMMTLHFNICNTMVFTYAHTTSLVNDHVATWQTLSLNEQLDL